MEVANRNYRIAFYLNGALREESVRPDETALELLRERMHLRGVKEGCAEGDCGACTIAIGEWNHQHFRYRAINSCLFAAIQLHGKVVITVEGLADSGSLHLIQQKLLDNHAVQCGYCTPGIVMSMFCLFAEIADPTEQQIKTALEGNLCRCTGYITILSAARDITHTLQRNSPNAILPDYCTEVAMQLQSFAKKIEPHFQNSKEIRETISYHKPVSYSELTTVLSSLTRNEFRFVNGGTDVFVEQNVHRKFAQHLIDLSTIPELKRLERVGDNVFIGGAVTMQELLTSLDIRQHLPMLCDALQMLGSHQIRNVATLAGNVAHASPIADGSVALLAYGAIIELLSPRGTREIPIDDFYLDYRKTALQPDEVITTIRIPVASDFASFWKSSKRVAVDIASVNSAFTANIIDGRIVACRFAFGGVAKTPMLCNDLPQLLLRRIPDETVIRECQDTVLRVFHPISDVRGSAEYRRILLKNHIRYHLSKLTASVKSIGGNHE
ncbi:MAG: FAD binding domain-containing protein [bacterium]|nr:FAD binding domain-containing protein [bacterium]